MQGLKAASLFIEGGYNSMTTNKPRKNPWVWFWIILSIWGILVLITNHNRKETFKDSFRFKDTLEKLKPATKPIKKTYKEGKRYTKDDLYREYIKRYLSAELEEMEEDLLEGVEDKDIDVHEEAMEIILEDLKLRLILNKNEKQFDKILKELMEDKYDAKHYYWNGH